MATLDKKNVRYNILTIIVYIIGIILIVQLFNIQIVHGQEFLEQSNSRLTRETVVKATRGNILDCNGNVIAKNITNYSLEIYKSKIEIEELNNTIFSIINVLEKNGDTYKDNFEIKINPIEYKHTDETKITNWLKTNNLELKLTAEQTLNKYISKYKLENYSIEDARKIIAIRYGMEKERI